MESFLVSYDLHSNQTSSLVVYTPHYLTETTFSKDVNNLVSVRQMITWHNAIVTSVVVVTKVGRLSREFSDVLGSIRTSCEVYILVVDDLPALEDIEVVSLLTCILRRDSIFWCRSLS